MLPPHLLFSVIILAQVVLGEGSNNANPTPLQWHFKEVPQVCAIPGVCIQAELSGERSLLFDGKTRFTWLFDLTHATNGLLNKTWSRVETLHVPPGRQLYALTSVGGGNKVVMNGGANLAYTRTLDDTWIFDHNTLDWTLGMLFPGAARCYHAMASLGDSNAKLILFGGRNELDNGSETRDIHYDDTWLFDAHTGDRGEWTQISTKTSTDVPSRRYFHTMALIGGTSKALLYGGSNFVQYLFDTYVFDLTTLSWKKLSKGPRLTNSNLATLEQNGVLLYGMTGRPVSWTFDLSTNSWTMVVVPKKCMRARASMTSIGVNCTVVLFGGINANQNVLLNKNTCIYEQKKNKWDILIGSAPISVAPHSRIDFAMASLGDKQVLLFGGLGGAQNNHLHEFPLLGGGSAGWILNLKDLPSVSWKKVKTFLSPPRRYRHAMAIFNSSSVILYGGVSFAAGSIDDTWLFDNRMHVWHKYDQPAFKSPPARFYHSMASTGTSGSVLLFGGEHGNFFLNDSWLFDGAWKQVDTLSTSPEARAAHAMASLGDTGQVVLFGGCTHTHTLGDTWIFDVMAKPVWIQIHTASPPSRLYHSLVSMGSTAVMYGGNDHNNHYLDDTWLFHRESSTNWKWTQLSTQMPGRRSFAMASVVSTEGIAGAVLFGGFAKYPTGTFLHTIIANDTWIIPNGCPIGHGGKGCPMCQPGTYKKDISVSQCTSCPANTTTGATGANAKTDCILCANRNNKTNGVCSVDLFSNSQTVWRCFPGVYGSQCQYNCPGGATNPCNENDHHGKCDSGPRGSGKCTCLDGFFGASCEKICDCHNGHCNSSASGNGQCTCTFMYWPSSNCSIPWMGILLGMLAVFISFFIWRFWKKRYYKLEDVHEDLQLNYELMGDDLQETKDTLQETKHDRAKLQSAWIVDLNEVTFEKVIGKGAFGEVWKGSWRGVPVAFKKMFPEDMEKFGNDLMPNDSGNDSGMSTAATTSTVTYSSNGTSKVALTMLSNIEVAVMMRLRHPRIVKFLGAGEIVDPPLRGDDVPRVGIFVILEYAAGGDLIHRLKDSAGSVEKFPWVDRVQCAMDVAEGMAYIHSEGFLHRDLKSLNVLCDQNGRCLIGESLGFF